VTRAERSSTSALEAFASKLEALTVSERTVS
jgi:hypothetical protein